DYVFLDFHLNEINSTELCIHIKSTYPGCKVYFLSGETTPGAYREAIDARADGLIAKNADREDFMLAISGKYLNQFFTDKSDFA
ncbi:response regulator, partial [Arthrospira platensis SPKY1]|nr:response regulator [Arthrospira platensis SPKY1]